MPSTTTYYDLTLYNSTTDGSELFSSFRAKLDGIGSDSNMIIIDDALWSIQSQVLLKYNGASFVSSSEGGVNAYTASGITSITSYSNGVGIILVQNVTNTGACTLNINSLGATNLCKIDSTGTIVNVEAGDVIANKLYYFVYYSTKWVLMTDIVPSELASAIHGATSKTTPIDADELVLSDSAATYGLKKLTWANLKTTFGVALGGMINGFTTKTTPVDADGIVISDSASSNATKKLTWANLKATLGTPTGSIVGTTDTQTLTNKRITPRVQSVADAATVTPNADTNDAVDITAIAQAFAINNPSGTPVNFQELTIRIKDDSTPRAITWDAGYVPCGVALPTTTSSSKIMINKFIYNTANALNKWMLVSSVVEV